MESITLKWGEGAQSEPFADASGGVWDWDMVTGKVIYSAAWANIMGYCPEELPQTTDTFEKMVFSGDLPYVNGHLTQYLTGKSTTCESRFRMRCKGGELIWVQAKGYVTEYDNAGKPVRFLGALENISDNTDTLRHLEKQLSDALASLEHNNLYMESAAVKHTQEMKEQYALLSTISQISKKLLAIQSNKNFESQVQECLSLLGESIGKNRVYIWKDETDEAGITRCTQLYEWICGVTSIRGVAQFQGVAYETMPTILAAVEADRCLNCTLDAFSDGEQKFLSVQGIKSILIAPIAINGRRWGFIGVDNCENELPFTSMEENMLMMSGSLLASTIEKIDTEAALREMEERAQIMLNATPLCCNLWTQEFCNMSCNDEAVRLFELSSQSEYLERFDELSPEYQPGGRRSTELAMECITKAFEEGYCRFEWLHQKLDGTPIPAEITLVRIKYRDSFIVAGYTRDLREQKAMLIELQAKEALRRARDEALMTSKAKSNFLANMSHEIRTPMNAIAGFADIIVRECIKENVREYAVGIRNACGNLINIINDILDISKIESGKLEIYDEPYELASLLNDVITVARMRLGNKPLMFITNIDSHLPAQLVGDEIRIRQILLNILSNAIKYTDNGCVTLRVSGTMEGERVTLRFSVKDSGIGIKAEDLARLFDEFERINTTKIRNIEGTGLGLAISKQLCEMMGGCIQVESVYGRGSEFIVFIPQECPSYERLAQVQKSKRVLLYEPRRSYRLSIVESLENLNCSCAACVNLKELHQGLSGPPYDYILTPALYLEKVQPVVVQKNLPAEVVAYADYGEVVKGDASSTMLFPINCLQLSAVLNGQQVTDSRMQRAKAIKYFVAPSARVLVVDDNSVNLQVAKGLMEPYQFAIDTAANGVEAVQMVQRTEYDMVFMDHMMPEMDGVDAAIAIRALAGANYSSLPIIALTANALVGTREMFIRNGMNDFLSKPIELSKLAQILVKWLPPSKVMTITAEEAVKEAEQVPLWQIEGVNTVKGLLSVGGSQENYLHILAAYYADGKRKCVSLPQLLENKAIKAFQIEVHALKSISASIGALELSRLAEELEIAAQNNNIAYISAQTGAFLSDLQTILNGIQQYLPQTAARPADVDCRAAGDAAYLAEVLDLLENAAEFAQINKLEEVYTKLQEFYWPEKVEKELSAIKAHLDVFDYDSILDCVIQLKMLNHSAACETGC